MLKDQWKGVKWVGLTGLGKRKDVSAEVVHSGKDFPHIFGYQIDGRKTQKRRKSASEVCVF